MAIYEKQLPLYTIYWYSEFVYRIVKFKRSPGGFSLKDRAGEEALERFSQSYSRSRSMVLQYALCNKWDYFITITVNRELFNAYELDDVYGYLSQWLRDYRKVYGGIAYVLVPERHKDGAWHFHGLISGICPEHVVPFVSGVHPWKLVEKGYRNFPLLSKAIGFVSLGSLKNAVGAGFYVTKYITKEHANDSYYSHLYYCTRGLKTARPVYDVYANDLELDKLIQSENDFCSTGWAIGPAFDWQWDVETGRKPWVQDREVIGLSLYDEVLLASAEAEFEEDFKEMQLLIAGWCNGNIPA